MEISHPLVTVEPIPMNEAWITHERMIGQFAYEDPDWEYESVDASLYAADAGAWAIFVRALGAAVLACGVAAGFSVRAHDVGGGWTIHAICAILGTVLGWSIRKSLRIRERRQQVERGKISEALVRETGGEAYAYRLLLLIIGFNELAEQFAQREKAVALGAREPLADHETVLSRLRQTRARLMRAIEMIELMRRSRASEESDRDRQDALIAALGLEAEGTGIRVVIDPVEANPDADEAPRAACYEVEAARRAS